MTKPRRAVVTPAGSPVTPASGPSTGRSLGASDVRCRYCGAVPGQPCRDRVTGAVHQVPHDSRVNDPMLSKWDAWHGDREAGRRVPPL